jgi:hypothetical protein
MRVRTGRHPFDHRAKPLDLRGRFDERRLGQRGRRHRLRDGGGAAALREGFEKHGLDAIVSFTVPENVRSSRVIHRIGMTRSHGEDFDHPLVPIASPLRRHVLYRIRREKKVDGRKEHGAMVCHARATPSWGGPKVAKTCGATAAAQAPLAGMTSALPEGA